MGKTSKPLTIVALPPCNEWPELEKLEKQGHRLLRLALTDPPMQVNAHDLLEADIIIGPHCWRLDNSHQQYLTLAIKESRMAKYETLEKRADSKRRAVVSADLATDELREPEGVEVAESD